MRLWKKIGLLLLTLLLVSQIPFAYRRYKIGELNAAIQQLGSQRLGKDPGDPFAEYTGVLHVHSFLGGHSSGSFAEIIAAAKTNQLSFVVMTEHPAPDFDTAQMTLQGWHGGVLFINGNEVRTATGDRLLVIPGNENSNRASSLATQDVLSEAKARGAMSLVAYPQEFVNWDSADYDGVEIYNVYTDARKVNPVVLFFDGLWSYRTYPDLLFTTFYSRPTENLRKWDDAISKGRRRLVAVAGNDAHSNIGITLVDASGESLFGVKLDPYQRSFRLVRMHALLPKDVPLDSASLLAALSAGHCFAGFDLFADSTGFRFSGSNSHESVIQGEKIDLDGELRLTLRTPVPTRVALFQNGTKINEAFGGSETVFSVKQSGSYRVEAYLQQLPSPLNAQPWIISNPIYVESRGH
jgi:hypothetical protein